MVERLHYVAIDGANFINRLIEFGRPIDEISSSLSIGQLVAMIQSQVRARVGSDRSLGADFFYTNHLIGPKNNRFTKEQQDGFITNASQEDGVTTRAISVPSDSDKEKGVDIAIASSLFEMSSHCETLVLVSADRDFIPVLQSLRRLGKFVCTVGYREFQPAEMLNESQYFFDIRDWGIFSASWPTAKK